MGVANGRHPRDRWTGRSLGEDARAANGFEPWHRLAELYHARYPEHCWGTHGSTLAGMRRLSGEDYDGVVAGLFAECARLGISICEIAARSFELMNELASQFAGLDEVKDQLSVEAYRAAKGDRDE